MTQAVTMGNEQFERRSFALDSCKIETRNDSAAKIVGHAAVFNQLSEDLGGFRELIQPGAFADAVQSDDVRALFNHDPNFVLGRSKSGTLLLSEDDQGLAIEISMPDTSFARDLVISMQRGDISQMSFGFRVKAGGQSWGEDENGNIIRTLTSLKLYDVSPVTFPAYPQTDAAVRCYDEYRSACLGAGAALHERRRAGALLELISSCRLGR